MGKIGTVKPIVPALRKKDVTLTVLVDLVEFSYGPHNLISKVAEATKLTHTYSIFLDTLIQRYLVVYIDTTLMLVTSIIYFIAATQDYTQPLLPLAMQKIYWKQGMK
jgi:hypothetical protein